MIGTKEPKVLAAFYKKVFGKPADMVEGTDKESKRRVWENKVNWSNSHKRTVWNARRVDCDFGWSWRKLFPTHDPLEIMQIHFSSANCVAFFDALGFFFTMTVGFSEGRGSSILGSSAGFVKGTEANIAKILSSLALSWLNCSLFWGGLLFLSPPNLLGPEFPLFFSKQLLQKTGLSPDGLKGTSHSCPQSLQIALCICLSLPRSPKSRLRKSPLPPDLLSRLKCPIPLVYHLAKEKALFAFCWARVEISARDYRCVLFSSSVGYRYE